MIFFLAGKCSAGSGILLAWVITAELYPTNLRSQSCGIFSTIAKILGLVCPYVANLATIWKPLPMLLMGIPSLFAAFLVFFIPETSRTELPQNVIEMKSNEK